MYEEEGEIEKNNDAGIKKCPKCHVPIVNKLCPICGMREIDMDDEDEWDRRERR